MSPAQLAEPKSSSARNMGRHYLNPRTRQERRGNSGYEYRRVEIRISLRQDCRREQVGVLNEGGSEGNTTASVRTTTYRLRLA
jgi:hypothetical protein